MKPAAIRVVAMLCGLQASLAFACGYCVEDKIASVYDHPAAMRAFSQKHQVAYFGIDGPIVVNAATLRELEATLSNTEGVDKGSLRISLESAALAAAFDPRRTTFASLQKSLEKKLAPKKLSLLPMRVMEEPAKIKPAP
jgi:hypothetical protein